MQTAGFRSLLEDYEFDFVEGQMPHVEGNWSLHTKDFASSKLWGYFNLLDPQDVMDSELQVLDLAIEEGPYDGILGYSQGATLAAQALIRHATHASQLKAASQEQGPVCSPPFKFAVFFNGATPTRVFEVTDEMRPLTPVVPDLEEPMALKFLAAMKANPLLTKTKLFPALLADGRRVLTDGTLAMLKCDAGRDGTLIHIPTLHARCATDEPEHGQELYELCDGNKAEQYFHLHKHDFPRGYDEMRQIARLIRETAEKTEHV
jgi:hypothetical protein